MTFKEYLESKYKDEFYEIADNIDFRFLESVVEEWKAQESEEIKEGTKYWIVSVDRYATYVSNYYWGGNEFDRQIKDSGNFFLTEAEALKKKEEIIKILKQK